MNADFNSLDVTHEIAKVFAPPSRRVRANQVQPTKTGVLSLLVQVTSESYLNSCAEFLGGAEYLAAHNAKWIERAPSRWSGGTEYHKHRITDAGRAAKAALRAELDVTRDEYSAEWLRAVTLADERKAQRTDVLRTLQGDDETMANARADQMAQMYAGAL